MEINKIYIRIDNEEFGSFEDLDSGLTSWSRERNNESDLKFISVSFLREKLEEIEDELKSVEGDSMSAGQKRIRLRGIKNMLNYLIKL